MKILLYVWIMMLPFVLQVNCGWSTPFVIVLIGIGFFGLCDFKSTFRSFLVYFPHKEDFSEQG
jgi:predicted membrane chloride channel (bestrophin family)